MIGTPDHKMQFATAAHEAYTADLVEGLGTRKNPHWCASGRFDKFAHWGEVEPLITSGDGMWYSGRKFHSWVIRLVEYSDVSHGGIWIRDIKGEFGAPGKVWIMDVCEGLGGGLRDPAEQIAKYPGRYYWSHVARRSFPWFDNDLAFLAATNLIGSKYGYLGIGFQTAIRVPFIREAVYFSQLDHWSYLADQPPFCSQAQNIIATKAGQAAIPNRYGQLITPQDTWQSLLWSQHKVALYPDDYKVAA